MNKNTLLAMVLIFGAFLVFTSQHYQRFYYKNILKQPYPVDMVEKKNKEVTPSALEIKENAGQEEESLPGKNQSAIEALAQAAPVETITSGDTIWVETDKLIVGISEIGAKIISLQTKEYRVDHAKTSTYKKDSAGYVDLLPKRSDGALGMNINSLEYDDKIFHCADSASGAKFLVKKGDTKTITFLRNDFQGKEIKKQFVFDGNGYRIGLKVINDNLPNNRLLISWKAGINESESNKNGMYMTEERKAHYFDGENVQHVKMSKSGKEDATGFFKWIGISSKYFLIALVADTIKDADLKIICRDETKTDSISGKKDKTKAVNYSFYYQTTIQGNSAEFWIYAGPAKLNELKKMDLEFEETMFPVLDWTKIFFWADVWFPPVAKFVLWLLLALFSFVKDYGIAIVLLTIISKIVTFPLTQSSMKSMNRMKDLQPKITALRSKYKSNPKKLNEETMALYKAEGVNPLNPGCLPMFLQMPVFIALYVVLAKAIELRGASTVLTPWIKDLSSPEMVFSFNSVIPGGIPFYGSNFAILPVVMAILTFFQNKMTIKDPNQKMMIYFMPIFMLVIFNNFPAGLVLYWTLQSALGIVQQWYLDKSQKKQVIVTETIYSPQRGKKKK